MEIIGAAPEAGLWPSNGHNAGLESLPIKIFFPLPEPFVNTSDRF
jgi:hypothetical protein